MQFYPSFNGLTLGTTEINKVLAPNIGAFNNNLTTKSFYAYIKMNNLPAWPNEQVVVGSNLVAVT